MKQITIIMTMREAREYLKEVNYVLRKLDDEIEVYPKGNRGDASHFSEDLRDAVHTARRCREFEFDRATESLPVTDEIRDALRLWHKEHYADWKEALHGAWYSGNYGYHFPESHHLQRLRNTNGHEVLKDLEIY